MYVPKQGATLTKLFANYTVPELERAVTSFRKEIEELETRLKWQNMGSYERKTVQRSLKKEKQDLKKVERMLAAKKKKKK